MMYRFLGYIVKNENGDVLGFNKRREEILELCLKNNIPQHLIKQIYELDLTEIEDVEAKTPQAAIQQDSPVL